MSGRRLLVLPRYVRPGASSRLRMWQYLPLLEEHGFDVDVRPLFNEKYVEDLQSDRRNPLRVVKALARRMGDAMRAGDYDLVWVEKEMLPFVPFTIERAFWPNRTPVVVDYDDAVYLLYSGHHSALVRQSLGQKIDRVMRRATTVVAGNPTLADYARKTGAKAVEILPTVVDLSRYRVRAGEAVAGPSAVWIGQRSTRDFLRPLETVMRDLQKEGTLQFTAIGIDARASGLPMQSIGWSEGGEADAIASCDIGIMPLPDTPFEQGKCGYKLIQYMACGLPVVASPVGINREIVEHGVNGFLASSAGEWREALTRLADDGALRRTMGAAGRVKVERDYSLSSAAPVLARLFDQLS